ncbi:hypothetical protein KCP73_17920 [Salmonella enterica subsp. enterica]|nr:hypothetical protein KCP73_17920 [Salmonella enterica subsp. enterica]
MAALAIHDRGRFIPLARGTRHRALKRRLIRRFTSPLAPRGTRQSPRVACRRFIPAGAGTLHTPCQRGYEDIYWRGEHPYEGDARRPVSNGFIPAGAGNTATNS